MMYCSFNAACCWGENVLLRNLEILVFGERCLVCIVSNVVPRVLRRIGRFEASENVYPTRMVCHLIKELAGIT